MNQVFIFIGRPGHGKSTCGRAFAEALGLRYGDTSDAIYDALAIDTSVESGKITPQDALVQLRAMPKEQVRPFLVRKGDEMCKDNPAALAQRLIHKGCRAFSGVRRRKELKLTRQVIEVLGLEPVVFWVSRNPPPADVKDNTEVTGDDADYILLNAYPSLEDLMIGVRGLAISFRPRQG